MATRSVTYCDRCKNPLSAVGPGGATLSFTGYDLLRVNIPPAVDLCVCCLRDFDRFMDDYPTRIPPRP